MYFDFDFSHDKLTCSYANFDKWACKRCFFLLCLLYLGYCSLQITDTAFQYSSHTILPRVLCSVFSSKAMKY